jgi:transposase InsO family protein
MDKELAKRYYTVGKSTAYGSLNTLYSAVKNKYTKKQVADWLSRQNAHTLHKYKYRKFVRRPTVVNRPNEQLQMDLADMTFISDVNDNMKYILTAIDVFSKYGRVELLKTKKGEEVATAIERMLEKMEVLPKRIQVDKGGEFINKHVKGLLKDKGILMFSTNNVEVKASVIERWNRTLKRLIYKHMTANATERYVDSLPKIVETYNSRKHRSIGMPPSESNDANLSKVWHRLYDTTLKEKKIPKLAVGDLVRMSDVKASFDKSYLPTWSDEYLKVYKVRNTHPVTYLLEDLLGERLEGSFYEEELQKIKEPTIFRVEKVLKRRKNKIFVKWKHWPDKFNSWTDKSTLVDNTRHR